MPQRPRNLVWGVLRSIYNVAGQRTTPLDIEFDLPVQPVHDLSREAELGSIRFPKGLLSESGESSFFTINVSQQTVGAATLSGGIGVYSNQDTSWALAAWDPPDPAEETVWVYGAAATIPAAGTISGAELMIDLQPKAGAGAGGAPRMLYQRWSSQGLSDGTDRQLIVGGNAGFITSVAYKQHFVPLLNKIATSTPLFFNTATAAGALIDYHIFCLRLPNGVFPPGFS